MYFRSMALQFQRLLLSCLVFLLLLFNPVQLSAQGFGGGGNSRIEGKTKFMPIPYMNYDRSMGFALGAVLAAELTIKKSGFLNMDDLLDF